jgi:hypothetical protein
MLWKTPLEKGSFGITRHLAPPLVVTYVRESVLFNR